MGYLLGALLNKTVFNWLLKLSKPGARFNCSGSLFHSIGAVTLKDLKPYVVWGVY